MKFIPNVWLVVAIAMLLGCCSTFSGHSIHFVDAAAKIKTFKEYPLLQCTGCEIMANEIGRRMNITAAQRANHKMVKGGASKDEIDYVGSETQAADVLELLCQDIRKNAQFKLRDNAMRIFSGNPEEQRSLPNAEFYNQKEATRLLINPTEQLEDMCEEILDNWEDVLVRAITRHRTAQALFNGMCLYGLKLCDKDYIQPAMQKEKSRYDAFKEAQEDKEDRKAAKAALKKKKNKKRKGKTD